MEEKEIYKGAIFTLCQKEVEINHLKCQRDIIHHPGGVGILLIQNYEILLVSQFRHAINKTTLEIPAGKLEYGEDPEACGFRELNEETGFTCKKLKLILSFVSTPGFCDERIWIYQAIEPEKAKVHLPLDEDEDIEQVWLDLDAAYQMCMDGKIDDAKTVIAIQHAKLEEGTL